MLLIVSESFSRVPKNIWNLVRITQTLRQCRSASYGGKVAWRCIGFSRAPLTSLMQLSRFYLSQMTVVEGQPP